MICEDVQQDNKKICEIGDTEIILEICEIGVDKGFLLCDCGYNFINRVSNVWRVTRKLRRN